MHDLLVRHGRHVARGKYTGLACRAARVYLDLAAVAERHGAAQPFRVRNEADLDEDAFEFDKMFLILVAVAISRPTTFSPLPSTSVVSADVMIVTLARLRSFVWSTASARSWLSNSISVTCAASPARSIAASTPELPPPITATRLPLNSGPSQCGQ